MSVVSVGGGMIGAEWNWLVVMLVVSVTGGAAVRERDLNCSAHNRKSLELSGTHQFVLSPNYVI